MDTAEFPKPAPMPDDNDVVQVLMPLHLARCFERRCLPIAASLAGPLLFSDDDVPSYIVQIDNAR